MLRRALAGRRSSTSSAPSRSRSGRDVPRISISLRWTAFRLCADASGEVHRMRCTGGGPVPCRHRRRRATGRGPYAAECCEQGAVVRGHTNADGTTTEQPASTKGGAQPEEDGEAGIAVETSRPPLHAIGTFALGLVPRPASSRRTSSTSTGPTRTISSCRLSPPTASRRAGGWTSDAQTARPSGVSLTTEARFAFRRAPCLRTRNEAPRTTPLTTRSLQARTSTTTLRLRLPNPTTRNTPAGVRRPRS